MAKNAKYWQKRFEAIEALTNQSEEQTVQFLNTEFTRAEKQLREQIEAWYGRFAKNNNISLADAQIALKSQDLSEFKWDVADYIKYGKENALDGIWVKELENASARFHITRLEALEMQTRQTIESLYGKYDQVAGSTLKKTYLDTYYHGVYEVNKGFNIGWDIAAIDNTKLEKIIGKPWTADDRTFSDRIWTNKQQLINDVHTHLTQNMILGRSPDAAIKAISQKMGVSKNQAGRLVMTESAVFSSMAQKDAFLELEVEEFEVVETLDGKTCEVCGAMDGKHFPMSDFVIGVTAPPFHPWCRGTEAPYFPDEFGARAARDENGEVYYVPSDMQYNDWKATFVDGTKPKDGLKVYNADGTLTYAKPKPEITPDPPKKEYMTKKKLQEKIGGLEDEKTALLQGLDETEFKKLLGNTAHDIAQGAKLDELNGLLSDYSVQLEKKLNAEKIKALTKQELELTAQFDALESKTYSGIWKDDVTTLDWNAKQGSIQAKKDYFEQQLKMASSPGDIEKWEKLLADLEEFNTEGASYYSVQNRLQAVKKELTNIKNGGIIKDDPFTQARKDAALWAKNTKEADDMLRSVSGETWRNATKAQKQAIYEYTGSYSKFNEPLRGIEYGTNKFLGVGNVNLDEIGMSYSGFKRGEVKKLIDNMTDIIDRSSYNFDVWVQRGVEYGGMDKFFGISPSDFNLSQKELSNLLLGSKPIDHGFFSTGVSKGAGFSSKPIIMNVYAPAGTKMMYAEPFSQYGRGDKFHWDGVSTQSSFGSEAEMIFQRGTRFNVTKVEKKGGKIFIDIEVVEQN